MSKKSVAPKAVEPVTVPLAAITISTVDQASYNNRQFTLAGRDLAHVVAMARRLGGVRAPAAPGDVNLMLRGLSQLLASSGDGPALDYEGTFFMERILEYLAALLEVQETSIADYRVTIAAEGAA